MCSPSYSFGAGPNQTPKKYCTSLHGQHSISCVCVGTFKRISKTRLEYEFMCVCLTHTQHCVTAANLRLARMCLIGCEGACHRQSHSNACSLTYLNDDCRRWCTPQAVAHTQASPSIQNACLAMQISCVCRRRISPIVVVAAVEEHRPGSSPLMFGLSA